MALTIEERKERYYKFVLEKANKIYTSWQANGITSKEIVAKANEYAFGKSLKLDASYRFRALSFIVALGIRLEKRYSTFLRRLFHFFAYIRERSALKRLKRVFGFEGDTDIREMIELEIENMVLLFSQQENRGSTGGGKRSEMGDISVEEALDSFFNEYAQEEEKEAENKLEVDKLEKLDSSGEPSSEKTEDAQREKFSVEELGKGEQFALQMKEKNASTGKEQTVTKETVNSKSDIVENEKIEKSVDKTVVNTNSIADIAILEQESEEHLSSPFPIFRKNHEGDIVKNKEQNPISTNEEAERKTEKMNGETHNKDIPRKTDRHNSPFPVFHGEKVTTGNTPEKTTERETKDVTETKDIKDTKNTKHIKSSETKTVHEQPKISEENKARMSLNTTMSEEEIFALVAQLISSANLTMNKDQQVQREKVTIEHGANEVTLSLKQVKPSLDKNVNTLGPKK